MINLTVLLSSERIRWAIARRLVLALFALTVVTLVALHAARNTSGAQGGPGTLIKNVPLPVPGNGVSVAVDCNGNVYYTLASNTNLYKMDKDGNLLDTKPITDSVSGAGLFIDEFAWDNGRQVLWAQEHNTNPIRIYQLNPTTGVATFKFAAGSSIGTFRDGIAYDASDDTLWISGDVSSFIDHVKASDGSPATPAQITPKNAGGGTLGFISGVSVGVGDLLYLGQNGVVQIVRVKKSNGDFIGSFASPGGARDEGLECDATNFAPKLALWSREFNSPGFMSVIELEPGTCACGGGAGDIDVALDIKPTSCPNPLNTNDQGLLPVAILGTASFDVTKVDVSTIKLAGVSPLRSNLEDVATPFSPFTGKKDCNSDCTTAGPDGFLDLTLKFDAQAIVAALGNVSDGQCVVVKLTGNLTQAAGGTPIKGEDVVVIRQKK